jgi:hypothetical protein
MKLSELIIKFLNKIIMALTNKKLSTYDDLSSANIDTTTKLVVLTGATKVNANLPVTNFIEDTLTSTSVVKPLSAKQGKALQDAKAPIASPTFTGTVGGVTKAMVGLGNVDNTSDANKPISTAQAAGLAVKSNPPGGQNNYAPITNPVFTGSPSIYDIAGETFKVNSEGSEVFCIDGETSEVRLNKYIQTFADNTAAAALSTGTMYKTSTGVLMIKY